MSNKDDIKKIKNRYLMVWVMLTIIIFYFLFKLGFPYIWASIIGKDHALPTPSTLMAWYMIMVTVCVIVYVTTSDLKIKYFVSFLVTDKSDPCLKAILRIVLLVLFPAWVGWMTFSGGSSTVASPTELRIQHPTLPGKFEGLENPFRKESKEKQLYYVEEGKILFQQHCRPCHGSIADGEGPWANTFRLKPANFRDPGTIGTIVENYPVWRIKEGGPGLPAEATPWDSTMPPWGPDFTDDQIWKIIMGEYVTADVSPRTRETLHE